MTHKTYNQYCAVAHALDIIGERWTLLVIRNLCIKAQRFSDLRKSLPGVSTNILTDRLKVLEQHNVITTRYLPPPAASTVYELTEQGWGLIESLAALGRWGARTLGAPNETQAVVPEAVCFMIQGWLRRENPIDINLNCLLRVASAQYQQTFEVGLSSVGVMLTELANNQEVQGDASAKASEALVLTATLEALNLLGGRHISLENAIAQDKVQVQGEEGMLEQLHTWLASP